MDTIASVSPLFCSHPELIRHELIAGPGAKNKSVHSLEVPPNTHVPLTIDLDLLAERLSNDFVVAIRIGAHSTSRILMNIPSLNNRNLNCSIVLEAGAVCELISVWGDETNHLKADLDIKLSSNANFTHRVFGLGSLTLNLHQVLAEECRFIQPCLLLGNSSKSKVNTTVTHESPKSISQQSILCLLIKSHFEIRGMIEVEPLAPQTNASLHIKAYLLDEASTITSEPLLEINHSDVICSHSSAMLFLEPETLFYLRSRAIDESAAKVILLEGILTPYLRELPDPLIKGLWHQIRHALFLKSEVQDD